jgi:phosphate/phosphite/phosphonate ABC transporter binding protein
MASEESGEITFGLVAPVGGGGMGSRFQELLRRVGDKLGRSVRRVDVPTYEELAARVNAGALHAAWLPPIVFLHVADAVAPVASIERDGNATYEAALVVRADSRVRSLEQLRKLRAGWVDRWSASGYVLPSMNLALQGLEAKTLFTSETFYGSHRAAILALVTNACDVTATYARADDGGTVTTGAWSEVEGAKVRVLQTFGAIPPDILAVRASDAGTFAEPLVTALRTVVEDDESLARETFGGTRIREGLAPGYASLRAALDVAAARGIFRIG